MDLHFPVIPNTWVLRADPSPISLKKEPHEEELAPLLRQS